MRSWCFDSQAATSDGVTTYDREYGSSDIREVVGKLIGNGVYATPSTNMQVVADSGMNVKVQPGCCWISGAYGVVDTAETITITGTGTILIVARFDLSLSARSISLKAVTSLTRNASIYDIQLASISVPSGTTSITQSMITDTRQNGTVCGIVTGVIDQIDTTNLFAQYQSSFNAFMATLENTLTGDVAGNLLTLINNHKNDAAVHIPESGILPANKGGTGLSTIAPNHIPVGDNDNTFSQYPTDLFRNLLGLGNTTGALPIENGGTGVNNLSSLRNSLGLGTNIGSLAVANGGTGSSTAAGAISSLGIIQPAFSRHGISGISEVETQETTITLPSQPKFTLVIPQITTASTPVAWITSAVLLYNSNSYYQIMRYEGSNTGLYAKMSYDTITVKNVGYPESCNVQVIAFYQ